MQKTLGNDVGAFIRTLHERHGVTFHLGTVPASIDERGVTFRWKDYRANSVPTSSCVATCCMFCPRAFTASATMGSWPMASDSTISPARELLYVVPATTKPQSPEAPADNLQPTFVCPHCHAAMIIILSFARGESICAPPALRAAA
jgi:hypothetical protein